MLRLLKKFLKQPNINYLVRLFLPPSLREKFPAYGLVPVNLDNGCRFKIFTDPKDALGTILYLKGFNQYELEVLPLVRRFLKESRVFFDIGAHTGLYALIAAAENPQLKIYSFEPVPEIFAYLTRNVQINGFKNIYAHQAALTDKDGQLDLYVPISDGICMVASANKEFRQKVANEVVSVKAIKLDSFVRDYEITQVDLIKIDTETTEIYVLKGAEQTIRKYRPVIFCELLANTDPSGLNQFFSDKNYCYYLLTENGPLLKNQIENHPKFWNYLFIPAEGQENLVLKKFKGSQDALLNGTK